MSFATIVFSHGTPAVLNALPVAASFGTKTDSWRLGKLAFNRKKRLEEKLFLARFDVSDFAMLFEVFAPTKFAFMTGIVQMATRAIAPTAVLRCLLMECGADQIVGPLCATPALTTGSLKEDGAR